MQTPDSAPFGLYLYDTRPADEYANATFTYWINDDQDSITWTARTGHSRLWGEPSKGASQTRPDGYTYTPYTWTYCGVIDPKTPTRGSDGIDRVWLGHFHMQATIRQKSRNRSAALTYWAQRSITLHRAGQSSRTQPQVLTFQRRAGVRGPFSGAGARSARTTPAQEMTEGTTLETVL